MSYNEETEDPYEKINDNGLRKKERRTTLRQINTPFPIPGYDDIQNMPEKVKIPLQRNAYLREAFFKCYFEGLTPNKENFKPEEVLRRFAKLFYYHQEIRIETRKLFHRYNSDNLKENRYSALKEYLDRLVNDGCKTLSNLPIPKYKNRPTQDDYENRDQALNAFHEWIMGKDQVNITFNPKKRDFPRPEEIFAELAGIELSKVKEVDGRSYINVVEKDHSGNNYRRISNLLWTQSIALIVRDAVEEIEEEIADSGILYAYIEQPTIQAAINHFNQTYPRAKEMDYNEKAYSIAHRYKNKLKQTPYKRESIAAHLRSMEE